MPGTLAPGDIERIAEYFGVDVTPDFINKNFLASDGFKSVEGGRPIEVPTIVPAQKPNGECVFLSSSGSCTIHAVSPFGCSHFSVCADTEEDAKLASFVEACKNPEYVCTWGHLHQRGLSAPPIAERKKKFHDSLRDLTGEQHVECERDERTSCSG